MLELLKDKSVIAVAARDRNVIATAMGLDEIMRGPKTPHGGLFEMDFRQARERGFWNFSPVGLAYLGPEQLFVLGEWGEVRVLTADGEAEEQFTPARGPMRHLRAVGDVLVASGAACHVFVRSPQGQWLDIGPSPEDFPDLRLSIFESIDGFAPDDLYAAGSDGHVWHYDGAAWTHVDLPTNLALHDIHCAPDGKVYACGQTGILARGRGDAFELIVPDDPLNDLWGVRLFNDVVYAASVRALLQLGEAGLEPCLDAMEVSNTFYFLSEADGVLWSAGEKNVIRFDGTTWLPVEEAVWTE